MQLQWYKRPDGRWYTLDEAGVAPIDGPAHGVFVIWRSGALARVSTVLYVGRGVLRKELADRRRDPLFQGKEGLRVTWANVSAGELDAVAAYLYQQLRPMWGEIVSTVRPEPVNLPLPAA